jgi:hypothetical protein
MRFECDGQVSYGLFEAYDTLCFETATAGKQGLSVL